MWLPLATIEIEVAIDNNGLKLLLEYDINQDQFIYQFVMGQYVPALQSMGLQMSEAWHTAYGHAPNRLIGFVCGDRQTMARLLESDLGSASTASWRSTSRTCNTRSCATVRAAFSYKAP